MKSHTITVLAFTVTSRTGIWAVDGESGSASLLARVSGESPDNGRVSDIRFCLY